MKRIGNIFEQVIESDNMRLAFWKASRGKRHRPDQRSFAANLSVELELMRCGLLDGEYPLGNYTRFMIYDPKERANNTATLAALMPDLAIDGAIAFNETTNVRLIRASIMNEGTVPVASGTQVTFRRGASDGDLIAEDEIGAVSFGTNGVYDAGFRWDMSGETFTSAFEVVYIAVDPTNKVEEIDENNNTSVIQLMTSLDTDGDGAKDGDEIEAGTDPTSETDVFKIVAADGSETYAMRVTWNAKSGTVYRVESVVNLTGPWVEAPVNAGEFGQSQQIAVFNGVLRYIDWSANQSNRFYRVKLVE